MNIVRAVRVMSATRVQTRAKRLETGVFIDADNVSHRTAEKALEMARKSGSHGTVIRAYKDWNAEPRGSGMIKVCERLGIEQVHVPRAAGKNSSDIRMCVDIMRALLETDMQRFVLVTGDSDFRHVLNEIRREGRTATVYHSGPMCNRWLVGWADEYVMLERD